MDSNHFIAVGHPRPVAGTPTNSAKALATWTAVLGPTAMLLAYRLAEDVACDGSATYSLDELADDLGVAPGKVTAAIKRLGRYDIALFDGTTVAIRLTLPEPPRSQPKAEALTLTVTEAADLLGISRGAAYQAVRDGHIPHVTIGRRILVPRERLLKLLAEPDD